MSQVRKQEKSMQTKRIAVATAAAFGLGVVPLAQAQNPTDSRNWPPAMHDNTVLSKVMIDRLEYRNAKPDDITYWEGQAWVGGDINKLWLKTEGEVAGGNTEDAELEAYYSRAVAAFWDVQFGLRHDFKIEDSPSRDWVGFGFKGLAPYRFEVDATAYAGSEGRTAARLKAEYELLLTQKLVLMPEVEFNLYGKADPERGLGSGLSDSEVGLRIRYEFAREFAPYVGVVWTNKYGGTADYARAAGAPTSDTQFVAGIRAWW